METITTNPETQETPETPETGDNSAAEKTFDHSATYSPEDNKLRIYPAYRLPRAEYDAIKSAGFKWAPKQELFVCPRWTPEAEDAALDLCGDIGDEEQPAAERAAERAERFDGYRENRLGEARQAASRFDSTGWRIAHARLSSNRRREQARTRGVSRWECAEYWRHRVAGVLSHSDYKDRADVRHRRIQGLESDRRKLLSQYDESKKEWDRFVSVLGKWAIWDKTEEDFNAAIHAFFGRIHTAYDYKHPTNPNRRETSLYDLTNQDQAPENKIDGLTALCLWFQRHPMRPDETKSRWLAHYDLRIGFERALLAEQGGTAAQNLADTLAPGAIVGESGNLIVWKVTKTKTGDLSRIEVLDSAKGNVCAFRAERFKWADQVRPATAESLARIEALKAKLKAAKPKDAPLINPTKEEAAKVTGLDPRLVKCGFVVHVMTSEQYARVPSYCKRTEEFDLGGHRSHLPAVCRVRFLGVDFTPGIVVLSDKPQKPLPFDYAADYSEARKIADMLHGHGMRYSGSDIYQAAQKFTGKTPDGNQYVLADARRLLTEYARKTWPAAFGVSSPETGTDGEDVAESETLETEDANA